MQRTRVSCIDQLESNTSPRIKPTYAVFERAIDWSALEGSCHGGETVVFALCWDSGEVGDCTTAAALEGRGFRRTGEIVDDGFRAADTARRRGRGP
jgi:hypothetical protein